MSNNIMQKTMEYQFRVENVCQDLSVNNLIEDFRWIRNADFDAAPFVCAYKREFYLDSAENIRIYVTADERYQLYLDGDFVGAGSERGDAKNWFFETYDLELTAGRHILVAKVWAWGDKAPSAQISLNPCCFTLLTDKQDFLDLMATGYSQWQSVELDGFSFHEVPFAFAIKWREDIDGNKYNGGYRTGQGDGWAKAVEFLNAENVSLKHSKLPKMLMKKFKADSKIIVNELNIADYNNIGDIKIMPDDSGVRGKQKWESIQDNGTVTIDGNKTVRVIFSFDDYYCAYPELRLSGGLDARVCFRFSEAAYLTCDHEENRHFRHPKGNRNEIIGKYFKYAMTSEYISNGRDDQLFDPLWWFSGIFAEMIIQTAEEPLTIENLSFYETRYPLELESSFNTSDKRFDKILKMCFRTLQNCTHETYMDCPFYEQIMYVGDARIESLATYISTLDARMPIKAINIINQSRLENGLNMSGYPYRGIHVIPPFSLLWIAMVSDYAYWNDESEGLVCSLLPDMRKIISYFLNRKNSDGLISPGDKQSYDAFNFIDWVDGWNNDWGVPHGDNEINSVFHWLFVYTLKLYADMESHFGNPKFAAKAITEAREISQMITGRFWDNSRGLYADDLKHESFSEHAQIMAILSGFIPESIRKTLSETLFSDKHLLRPTVYFSHYYFEVCRMLENTDAFWERMKLWYELEEKNFKTVCEAKLPTRSDCHAWSAHPLYHFYATILGIRPSEFGFKKLEIKPMLGKLNLANGKLIHKKGCIEVGFNNDSQKLSGKISLPEGINGELVTPEGERLTLSSGCKIEFFNNICIIGD